MNCQQGPEPVSFQRILCETELSLESRAICRPHHQRVEKNLLFLFFMFLCVQLLDDDVVDIWNRALATVLCTFCRPYLQKVEKSRQSLTIFVWNRALATVSCTFCRPHLQKVEKTGSFLRCLSKIELSLQSRAHFVGHFPDRGAQPRKQRPSSGDHGWPLYPKKYRLLHPRAQAFAPARGFEHVNTCFRDRSHFATTWWWCDWHSLTSWCGWHDDWDGDVVAMMVRQLAIDKRP